MNDLKNKIDTLTKWIRDTAPAGHGLLVPVSGGSDSALCFWLCAQARPDTRAVFAGEALRAEEWFRNVGKVANIAAPAKNENPEIARWAKFLELNLKEGRVLVGTRNRTEDALGTYSHASRIAAFLPLVGVWKSDVLRLCEYIGVPEEVMASSRRADPECGRPAELAEIPVARVDAFLMEKEGTRTPASEELGAEERRYLEMLYARNRFKADLPARGIGL